MGIMAGLAGFATPRSRLPSSSCLPMVVAPGHPPKGTQPPHCHSVVNN